MKDDDKRALARREFEFWQKCYYIALEKNVRDPERIANLAVKHRRKFLNEPE